MGHPASRKVIKPSDCILAFGIPTSIACYCSQRRTPLGWDFAPNYQGNRSRYLAEFVKPVQRIE